MQDRIKEIRKAQTPKLSQDAFGARIGVTGAAISRIESGERNVTDQMILAICREFGVNEKWLRTGEGEMFKPKTRNESLTEFFSDVLSDGDSIKSQLLSVMAKLSTEQWELLDDIAHKLYDELESQKNKPGD